MAQAVARERPMPINKTPVGIKLDPDKYPRDVRPLIRQNPVIPTVAWIDHDKRTVVVHAHLQKHVAESADTLLPLMVTHATNVFRTRRLLRPNLSGYKVICESWHIKHENRRYSSAEGVV